MNESKGIFEHIEDLRGVFIRSLTVIGVGFVIALFFSDRIFELLMHPLKDVGGVRLVVLSPIEGFVMAFKVCFWFALIASSPIWIFFVIQFVRPALYQSEVRMLAPFLVWSFLALSAGVFTAYKLTLPFANAYFYAFNSSFAENFWSLSSYINFSLFVMIANACAFEIGCILFLLVHYGVLTDEMMISKRRLNIVLAFILGALLTPPDVPSQLVMATCLIAFYECAILYAKFQRRGRSERLAFDSRH